MKVLHIFYEIKFSGAEIMYNDAASLFIKEGFELNAIASGAEKGDFSNQFEHSGISVFHMPLVDGTRNPILILAYVFKLLKFIKAKNIEVLHVHRSGFFLIYALIGYLSGIPIIRTMHNVFQNRGFSKLKGIWERRIAKKLFKVRFQTIGNSVYINELDYFKNPSKKINNWYNSEKFYPPIDSDEKLAIRKQLNISENSFVIVSTGGCTHIKNHHAIIQALAKFDVQRNIEYLHLGQGHTTSEEMDLATQLGVKDKIRFLGNRMNVRDYLIASDVYLMTSKFEGLSIAAIEAMACGLPSILYNSPGLRDLIQDDDNGFLIEPDEHLLKESLLHYYNNNNLAKAKGQQARLFATEFFSMQENVAKIIELYKQ